MTRGEAIATLAVVEAELERRLGGPLEQADPHRVAIAKRALYEQTPGLFELVAKARRILEGKERIEAAAPTVDPELDPGSARGTIMELFLAEHGRAPVSRDEWAAFKGRTVRQHPELGGALLDDEQRRKRAARRR